MPVIKPERLENEGYTILVNEVRDLELPLDVLGLYIYMLSKPEDWEFRYSYFKAKFGWGNDRFAKALRLLESRGLAMGRVINPGAIRLRRSWTIYGRPNLRGKNSTPVTGVANGERSLVTPVAGANPAPATGAIQNKKQKNRESERTIEFSFGERCEVTQLPYWWPESDRDVLGKWLKLRQRRDLPNDREALAPIAATLDQLPEGVRSLAISDAYSKNSCSIYESHIKAAQERYSAKTKPGQLGALSQSQKEHYERQQRYESGRDREADRRAGEKQLDQTRELLGI